MRTLTRNPVELALIIVVFGSIGWVMLLIVGPISLPFQGHVETIDVVGRVEGHRLHVAGTTTLPDGALIDWSVWRDPQVDLSDLPGGQATATAGSLSFDTDLTGWVPGPAELYISFGCDWGTVQPKPVTDLVGDHCEHLRGEQVYVDSPGDPKQLFVKVAFVVPSR